jgi:hypothetical protein
MKTFFEYKADGEDVLKEDSDNIFDGELESIVESFEGDFDNILNEIDQVSKELELKELYEAELAEKSYRIYKDRDENFECNVAVEGASIDSTQVRLILDTEIWNIVFYGKLYVNGTCVVPIKRGVPFTVGTTGKIRLEVVVDDQLFIGWEDNFIVEASKKVKVEIKEQKAVKVIFNK